MTDNVRARNTHLASRWLEQDQCPALLQTNIRRPSFPNFGLVLRGSRYSLDSCIRVCINV